MEPGRHGALDDSPQRVKEAAFEAGVLGRALIEQVALV
jgi:hypothetical protein